MSEEPHVSGDQEVQAAAAPEAEFMNHDSEQERQVPLTALESERSKRQQLEEENRLMKEHFALLQSNQRQSAPAPQARDEFEGLDDSDVLTVADFKKLSSKMANQFSMTLEEVKMTQKHPDYQEVISKYLPEVLNQNPSLKSSLQKSQDYELAYYLAKNSESYKAHNKKSKINADAERIIKNSSQAGSLSSMGSSTPVGQAKRYKDLSDDEFRMLMHKNLGY
jgi:hypothetical protein